MDNDILLNNTINTLETSKRPAESLTTSSSVKSSDLVDLLGCSTFPKILSLLEILSLLTSQEFVLERDITLLNKLLSNPYRINEDQYEKLSKYLEQTHHAHRLHTIKFPNHASIRAMEASALYVLKLKLAQVQAWISDWQKWEKPTPSSPTKKSTPEIKIKKINAIEI